MPAHECSECVYFMADEAWCAVKDETVEPRDYACRYFERYAFLRDEDIAGLPDRLTRIWETSNAQEQSEHTGNGKQERQ